MAEITDSGQVEKPSDFDPGPKGIVKRWLAEIERAKKEFEDWEKRSQKIIKRYKDERGESETANLTRRFNVLWSNMQILQPSVYARNPKVVVDRRFLDSDKSGRTASEILERCLTTSVDQYDFKSAMCNARDDFLLCARGQGWVRYIPVYGDTQTDADGKEFREVAWEEVRAEYIARDDFVHEPSPYWERVGWVAKKAHLSYREGKARFGAKFEKVPLKDELKKSGATDNDKERPLFARAPVWEIWNKDDRKVYWICPDFQDEPLDIKEDPLGLQDFFPCPRPLYGTTAPGSLVPIPDYAEYQDQALELDALTERIHYLTKALKVVGGYNKAATELGTMLEDGNENYLVPVENWTALAENGGFERQVGFFPVEKVQAVLAGVVQIRDLVKRDLDEISGMSDLVRGQGRASESATAQRIKGNFTTLRLQDKQTEMERFVRDILRIKAEIIAEQFSPNTLRLMSGFDQMPGNEPAAPIAPLAGAAPSPGAPGAASPPGAAPGAPTPDQKFAEAVAILKSDKMRTFRVSVETESTIGIDREQEKKDRTEFVMATAQFLQNAQNIGAAVPELQELLAHLLMFGVRGFRTGRELEQIFESTIQKMADKQKALASQPPQPPPEVQKAQLEAQSEMQIKDKEIQGKTQIEQMKLFAKQQAEAQSAAMEQQRLQWEAAAEKERAKVDAELEQLKIMMQAMLKKFEIELKAKSEQQSAQLDHQMAEREDAREDRRAARDDMMAERQSVRDEIAAARQASASDGPQR